MQAQSYNTITAVITENTIAKKLFSLA